MTAERWHMLSRVLVAMALLSVVGAWAGYGDCVVTMADGIGRELNPLTEAELGRQIETLLDGAEPAETWGGRVGQAHPYCYEENTIGDNAAGYGLFMFFLFAALFARNQSRFEARERLPTGRSKGVEFDKHDGPIPDEIDVGELELDLSEEDKELLEAAGEVRRRDESLLIYLDDDPALQAKKRDDKANIDGFYCPPGFQDKPIIYVDPGHAAASDELAGQDPVNDPSRPFATLGAAMEMARRLLREQRDGVMVRVMPGVYHASLEIPDRVVLCNHHLPADGTGRSRLKWLAEHGPEQPDSVTILTPAGSKYAVKFDAGVRQGIFGCHIVGRDDEPQVGIVINESRALAIMNCSVEGFIKGGVRIKSSGTELPGGAVTFAGCRLHRNQARHGGAIHAEQSVLNISDSIIERNRALSGGAVYVIDLRGPLFIARSRISYNRAQLEEPPAVNIEGRPLNAWVREDGLGGGIYARNAKLKVSGTEFVENGASLGGGGTALLNCKGVFEDDEDRPCRFARNRARLGGGVAAFGAIGARTTVKCSDLRIDGNQATHAGAGLVALGICTVQLLDVDCSANEISNEDGYGAGVAAVMGAELLVMGGEYTENKSKGHGGGLALVNARGALKGDVSIRQNSAKISGGGIFAMTTANLILRDMVKAKTLKIPLPIQIAETKIDNNVSGKLGGGLRGGNAAKGSTLPIGFKIADSVRFQLNRSKSQQENGDDIWIVWAGKVMAHDRQRPPKLVLR